jgi:hypothetical protein
VRASGRRIVEEREAYDLPQPLTPMITIANPESREINTKVRLTQLMTESAQLVTINHRFWGHPREIVRERERERRR